jgi:ubiquitin-conjugating enzyme E2 S
MCSDLSSAVVKVLTKEVHGLHQQPAEGIRVILNEHNVADIQAEIDGPTGTPYEGGVFRMKLSLSSDYPNSPPKGFFITKIFHPNVSTGGEICVNVLKRDWNATLGLRHVLAVIRCLLIEPFPESALNEEAGKLLLENYDDYARRARSYTEIHAQACKRPMPLTASGANAGNSDEAKEEVGSPASKKAKPDRKPGMPSQVKKSLKRL